ncbi:MAG: polymer-forming cytoskeletal protein [Pseudohongiellaceae bacterium]
MFGSSDSKIKLHGPANTLISRSTEIVGNIHFSGELIIEGKVKGNIYADEESDALIRIADKGAVEGEICVPSIIVNGLVQGDIRSTKHIELAAKAVVVGNVYYHLIEMVMGSEVNGSLLHISGQKDSKRLLRDTKKSLPEPVQLHRSS